ncbi:hypothetical protein ATCC90586_007897 [Pythium insidiosum]|nr:hypothetical protein ATCC90586_007897 [Pythium insidiosum]
MPGNLTSIPPKPPKGPEFVLIPIIQNTTQPQPQPQRSPSPWIAPSFPPEFALIPVISSTEAPTRTANETSSAEMAELQQDSSSSSQQSFDTTASREYPPSVGEDETEATYAPATVNAAGDTGSDGAFIDAAGDSNGYQPPAPYDFEAYRREQAPSSNSSSAQAVSTWTIAPSVGGSTSNPSRLNDGAALPTADPTGTDVLSAANRSRDRSPGTSDSLNLALVLSLLGGCGVVIGVVLGMELHSRYRRRHARRRSDIVII